MAGIIATSATTNNSASTSADNSVSGYLTGESIVLTATPSGTTYEWVLSKPSTSARAVLSSASASGPTFTPDVAGTYVAVLTLDTTTTYILQIDVLELASALDVSTVRCVAITDAQCPTPSTGVNIFYSSTQASLAIKKTDGSVETIDTTAV